MNIFSIKRNLAVAFLLSICAIGLSSCQCEHVEEPTAPFKLGHVLCSDGTVLSLCDWRISNKKPVGIVFNVNEDPASDIKGYAVYIQELNPVAFADSCGVAQGTSMSLTEKDGNANTYAIYSTKGISSPMANIVFDLWSYGQSAFVPSIAELRMLYNNKNFVNERILAVGGEPISSDFGQCWLWSSTEVEGQQQDKAWLFSMNYGDIHETPKDQPHSVRPIITIRK